MFLQRLWQWLQRPATGVRARPAPRRRARLMVEPLEDRTVPATFTASTVADLIADINAANQSTEADTITLAPGSTFTMTAVNNTDHGSTGLPVIAAGGGGLTIIGNGDVIERSTAAGTPWFRLFDVAAGASLTLQNLTLQGGLVFGWVAQGGAIHNAGSLSLNGVIVQNNTAQGPDGYPYSNYGLGGDAQGGAIYSSGTLVVEGSTIRDNLACGGAGSYAMNGGSGWGGGVYVADGTATLRNTIVTGNTAKGGPAGPGWRYTLQFHAPQKSRAADGSGV